MDNVIEKKNIRVRNKASIALYTYINSQLNILVCRNKEEDTFKIPNTEITKEDNVGTFAIVRLIVSEFFGIFSENNLKKLYNKEQLSPNDVRFKSMMWYELTQSDQYYEWCDIISRENIIQYDDLNDEILYFYELKEIDLSFLNNNLYNLGINLHFEYYDFSEKLSYPLDKRTDTLFSTFNFDNHIQNSIKALNNGDFSYFIILSIKDMSSNARDQAGFFHFPALFQGLYKENKEKWLLYCAGTLVFPSEEILAKTKAIIIPGSALNIYNNIPFVVKTEEWLRLFHEKYINVKILGICFGEQLICHSYGGKVDMLEMKKKDKSYFVSNLTACKIDDELWDIPFIKESGVKPSNELVIMQAHGDEVVEYPDFMKNYASSETCTNEVLVSNDYRYFLIQGHPEYSPEFNIIRVIRFFSGGRELSHEEYEKIKNDFISVNTLKHAKNEWRAFCYSFLKN